MKKILVAFIVMALAFGMMACGDSSGDGKDTSSTDGKNKSEVAEGEVRDDEIVLGKAIEFDGFTVTVQKYFLSKDYQGQDVLVIEYDWVNDSDKTTAPSFTLVFKGFQDGVETDVAVVVDNANFDSSLKDVKPGASLEGVQYAVVVPDTSKPFELELEDPFAFGEDPFSASIDLSTLK